jgi:hypothetical protein
VFDLLLYPTHVFIVRDSWLLRILLNNLIVVNDFGHGKILRECFDRSKLGFPRSNVSLNASIESMITTHSMELVKRKNLKERKGVQRVGVKSS